MMWVVENAEIRRELCSTILSSTVQITSGERSCNNSAQDLGRMNESAVVYSIKNTMKTQGTENNTHNVAAIRKPPKQSRS